MYISLFIWLSICVSMQFISVHLNGMNIVIFFFIDQLAKLKRHYFLLTAKIIFSMIKFTRDNTFLITKEIDMIISPLSSETKGLPNFIFISVCAPVCVFVCMSVYMCVCLSFSASISRLMGRFFFYLVDMLENRSTKL